MKFEDIDDDSDSIFFEDPLDEVEESIEDYHNELNPKLWDKVKEKRFNGKTKYTLKIPVAMKLKEIAKAFIDYLDINDDAIEDIVITGSSAGYNYTPYSDLDLHLVIDYDKVHEDCPIVEGFLWSMKAQFNKDHDISIYGIPVELYAEKSGAGTIHNGLYSLMQNKWIDEPKKIVPPDNDAAVEAKYNELKEAAEKIEDSEVAKELLDKIYTMRKAGLAQGGELSTENLAFKKLRNDGTIEKLKQMEKEQIDKELSLEDFSEDPLDEIEEDQLHLFDVKDYSNKQDGRSNNSFKPAMIKLFASLNTKLDMANARVLDDKGYFWTIPAKVSKDNLNWLVNMVKQKLTNFSVKTKVTSNYDSFDDCYINIEFIK